MTEVIFRGDPELGVGGLEEIVDFQRRNVDALLHHALLDLLDGNVPAQALAQYVHGHAVVFELRGKLGRSELIGPADLLDGLVDLLIADPVTHPLRGLQLEMLADQMIHYLLAQHVHRRQCVVVGAGVLHHLGQALIQLRLHDHGFVDHGDHLVQRLGVGVARGSGKSEAGGKKQG